MAYSVDDVLRVAAVFLGSPAGVQENVFHLKIMGLTVGTDDAVHADIQGYIDAFYELIVDRISADVNGHEIQVIDITSGAATVFLDFDPAYVGTAVTTYELPEGCAALLVSRTGVKRRIGRKFLPQFTAVSIAAGRWNSTTLGQMQDCCDFLASDFIGTTGNRYHAGIVNKLGASFLPFNSGTPSPIPAYQRRRREGRGI